MAGIGGCIGVLQGVLIGLVAGLIGGIFGGIYSSFVGAASTQAIFDQVAATSPEAAAFSRVPSGHPEGYHDAFANLYRAFAAAVAQKQDGVAVDESQFDYPVIDEGIDGVRFIEKCVESSAKGAVWVDMI